MTAIARCSRYVASAALLPLAACTENAAGGPLSPEAALFAKGGNSAAAHACQKGGYLDLMGSDGARFSSVGECVSYAARGGTLLPVPSTPPVIHSLTLVGVIGCDIHQIQYQWVADFEGGTGIVSGFGEVTSGVTFTLAPDTTPSTLTVTNAAGGSVSTAFQRDGGGFGCPVEPQPF